MPLHHVSYRGRGSLVGPRPTRYFFIAANDGAEALRIAAESMGDPNPDGEFTVARAKQTSVEVKPRVVRQHAE